MMVRGGGDPWDTGGAVATPKREEPPKEGRLSAGKGRRVSCGSCVVRASTN
jgi:hypothetical protein